MEALDDQEYFSGGEVISDTYVSLWLLKSY
jgi:hypothetical protein